ncbi:TlpA disulfide reductase family protein [Profundibacterium mesophilum]|uniref:Thioldisulfide interchange protein n=1 Tax=Profundibacterium mesophilum KAUST100406-0324 TaxID=1037889 RepID=A0A921NTR5_9RHOB|nr:TlpA disulfide reductase family protein [Profundibacterium mesophilum]KAF0676459.1 Thioldisulfide interchange protein [Profundibacterium mesophilum KAUST100406-0324]
MKKIELAVLYMAIGLGANLAVSGQGAAGDASAKTEAPAGPSIDVPALEALREGSMKKLIFHSEPRAVSQEPFEDAQGETRRLGDWSGKPVLVNFWATWCAPCRTEMPLLDALQAEFGGEGFDVVTIATARSAPGGVDAFFADAGLAHLEKFYDADQALARDMAVLGLPVTLLLDAEGREIARMQGDADWFGESAKAIVAQLMEY